MTWMALPADSSIPEESAPLVASVQARLGLIPNVIRLMALSPAVLNGFMGLQQALGGKLDQPTREAIALVVSEANGCAYCLAAHTRVSTLHHTPADEIARNRNGDSSDPKLAAAAAFARELIDRRGHVPMRELQGMRDAGYSDAEVLEVVALAVQFLLMNFINTVAGTEIDFPAFGLSDAS